MDRLVKISAVLNLVLLGLVVIGGPFLIGKSRKVYSASDYLTTLVSGFFLVVLVGRCLGWW